MSTNLFNYTNQKLTADKLREVEAFNSSNFGGIVGTSSPISILENVATLSASESSPVTFLGGGLLINQTSAVQCNLNVDNKLWYLEVILDSDAANITTNELIDSAGVNKISFKSVVCDSIEQRAEYVYYTPVYKAEGNPQNNQYYEYMNDTYTMSGDSIVDPSKIYYSKLNAYAVSFTSSSLGTASFLYYGNTLWLNSTTFIIPLCAMIDGSPVQTVTVKDITDLENLLSLQAYANLKAYADGNFVWSTAGREWVTAVDGSTHRKGDIGNLNITGDTIYNNTNYGTDSNPDYHDPVKIQNLTINNIANTNNDIDTKLVVDADGNISTKLDYIQPVIHGGTGASDRATAKTNLGIFYGEDKPTPSNRYTQGDIYLWIIE